MKRIITSTGMYIFGAISAILSGMIIGINATKDSPFKDGLNYIHISVFASTIIALVLYWQIDRKPKVPK